MENTTTISVTTEELQKEISLLKQQNAELQAKLDWFMEQFRLSQQKRFGSSSEQTQYEQVNLFNEAEAEAKPDAPEPIVEEITYKRRKKKGHREEMMKDLPEEVIEYRLPVEEQVCPCCGGALHEMSTEVRQELKVIPAQVSVVKHVRFIYACRDCDENNINTPIKTAPMPKPALPGSPASASAIAYVMSQKFVFGLPLYRQEQQWEQLGVEISRQTMANWIILSSERWFRPVYELMREYLLRRDITHADETTLQVLHEDGRPAESKSYMWLYRTGREGPPIILYDYQTTRASKHPERFLKGFKGYLCTDGYSGYNDLPGIINVACWSHARRKFDEALKAMPKTKKDTPCAAQEGLNFCNKLFAIERELHDVTAEERYTKRLEKSRPVLDQFKTWLKYQRQRITPKSVTGMAVQYCLNQWDKLEAFLLDGRLELSNNRSERTIKSFVMGRKAWIFNNTPKGANASATIYSVVETARENGLNPFEYLKFLLEQLPNIDLNDKAVIDKLLPWSTNLPEYCKMEKK